MVKAEASTARVVLTLLTWFAVSIGLIMYNKWMLSYLGFHFPIALMVVHQSVCTVCSFVMIKIFRLATPPVVTNAQMLTKLLPLALTFSASISFMNSGQLLLSVSFLQMLKASIPFWTVVIAALTRTGDPPSARLVVNVIWIGAGVAVAAFGAIEFQWYGVLLTLTGIIFECIRLVLSQKLLQGSDIRFNALTGVHFVAPLSLLCLLVPYFWLDHERLMVWLGESTNNEMNLWRALPYLLTNGVMAYCLNIVVYNVIIVTSAVTTGVAGKAKDVINVTISSLVFNTTITSLQAAGYAIAMSGVAVYTWDKLAKKRLDAQRAKVEDGADLEMQRRPLKG
eukprot:g8209.t1